MNQSNGVCAESPPTGLAVTLGRHDTQKAAEAEAEKMRKEGFYRNVTVERIEQVDNPQVPDGKAPAGG